MPERWVSPQVDSSILHEIVRVIEARGRVPERVRVRTREYHVTYLEDHKQRLEEALRRHDPDRLNMLYGQLASKVKYQLLRIVRARPAEKKTAVSSGRAKRGEKSKKTGGTGRAPKGAAKGKTIIGTAKAPKKTSAKNKTTTAGRRAKRTVTAAKAGPRKARVQTGKKATSPKKAKPRRARVARG